MNEDDQRPHHGGKDSQGKDTLREMIRQRYRILTDATKAKCYQQLTFTCSRVEWAKQSGSFNQAIVYVLICPSSFIRVLLCRKVSRSSLPSLPVSLPKTVALAIRILYLGHITDHSSSIAAGEVQV